MGHVPMTRPEEVLAVHEWNYGHSVTFAELEDRRVLLCGGWEFRISEDWGLTWSEPFRCTDVDGNPVGGSGAAFRSGAPHLGASGRAPSHQHGPDYRPAQGSRGRPGAPARERDPKYVNRLPVMVSE